MTRPTREEVERWLVIENGKDGADRYVFGDLRRLLSGYLSLLDELEAKDQEIARLKTGKFTEEEFQNLCHELSEDGKPECFAKGCIEYQKKLFGYSPTELQIKELQRNQVIQVKT